MVHKQHRQVNIPAVPHKKEGAYCAFPQCEWKYGEYLAVVVRHCAPWVVTITITLHSKIIHGMTIKMQTAVWIYYCLWNMFIL